MPLRVVSSGTAAHMPWSGLSLTSATLSADPVHEWANSNQDSIITGGPTQHTHGTFLEHPAQVIKETAPLNPTGHPLPKATPLRLGATEDPSNIYKRKEAAKMRRQRNVPQVREQDKSIENTE